MSRLSSLSPLVLSLLSLPLLGCFSPRYLDGGLACAINGACPDGMSCHVGRCWLNDGPGPQHQPDAAVEAPVVDAAMVEAGPDVTAPRRGLGETCDPLNAGTPNRSDNCTDGLVCVDGSTQSLCFKRCANAGDCGPLPCEQRRVEIDGPFVSVCGVPPTSCSPVMALSGACPAQRVCYLRASDTICEISGGERIRTACTYSRECFPGHTCATGIGAGYCRRVCSLDAPCPVGSACQLDPSGSEYGYCY